MKTFLYPKSGDSGPVPQYQLSVSPEIRAQVDGSIGRSPTDEIASMVPATSTNATSTTTLVPSASAGSSITTGHGHDKEATSRERRPSTETSHARQSTSHGGMTCLPVTNREGPSANNKQHIISSSAQQNTPQNSTTISPKDIKKDKREDDCDSNVGELTRL